MPEITPYVQPAIFDNQDPDTIYERMTEVDVGNSQQAKDILDVSQGSFFWDANRPSAVEKSRMIEEQLNEVIKAGFPQYAIGVDLDNHGQTYQVVRRAAQKATGQVTFSGTSGTVIPAGFKVATAATGSTPSIEFETLALVTIGGGGTINANIQAVIAGTSGNVSTGTITLPVVPLAGVTGITNAAGCTGGLEEEDDDTYRQRILEVAIKNPGSGSKYDYIRWAKEVPGVGDANCVPEWQGAGTGTVKVIIVDMNGEPATQNLIDDVAEYICGPNGDDGLAPVGAIVTVVAPSSVTLNYAFIVTLEDGADIETIETQFAAALAVYYGDAVDDGVVRFHKVAALLMGIAGVIDYTSLTINAGTSDVTIDSDEYPVTGTVTGTEA